MPRTKKAAAQTTLAVEAPRLGVMSNLFRGSPAEVAKLAAGHGLESVQLLPQFPGLRIDSAEDATPKRCREMAQPFLDEGLWIAGITAATNFLDPEIKRRKAQVMRFDALLENLRHFGTKHLVTDAGTLLASRPWEDCPENHADETLKLLTRRLRPSVARAEQAKTMILLTCDLTQAVSSIKQMQRLSEDLGPALGFVMEPAGLCTRAMASASKKPLREIFAAVGAVAPVAHAKDIRFAGGHRSMPRCGTGTLDYREYLELLGTHQPGGPLIIEGITPAQLPETLDYFDRFFPSDAK